MRTACAQQKKVNSTNETERVLEHDNNKKIIPKFVCVHRAQTTILPNLELTKQAFDFYQKEIIEIYQDLDLDQFTLMRALHTTLDSILVHPSMHRIRQMVLVVAICFSFHLN